MAKKTTRKTTRRPAAARSKRAPRIKKPPVLFDRTQRVIKRVRGAVEGTFLTYWTSQNGSVCGEDDTYVCRNACECGPAHCCVGGRCRRDARWTIDPSHAARSARVASDLAGRPGHVPVAADLP